MGRAVKELYNRIAIGKIIDDIQAAKVLFNGKGLFKGSTDGIEQNNPVCAAMGDQGNITVGMAFNNPLHGRANAISSILKALAPWHLKAHQISQPCLPSFWISLLQFCPGSPLPITNIQFT